MTLKYNEIQKIISHMKFNDNISLKLLTYIKKNEDFLITASNEAYEGDIPNILICKRKPYTRLAIILYKLVEVKKEYERLGLPEDVFYDTISDIKLRQEIYFEKNKSIGLSKDDAVWFRHIFNIVIFKIGSLQFQKFNMIYLDEEVIDGGYMKFTEEQKRKLPTDSPVINVHIQKGADLTPSAIDDSFSKAVIFFKNYFPEHKAEAFFCYSWLLYSGNKKLLNNNSSILNFANKFDIISEVEDREQAIERIYGKKFRKKSDYPQKTSLQRNALNNFKNLGYACGVIYL